MTEREAFLIVDVQFDFLPGGALAVPRGDEVLKPILRRAADFRTIVLSQDWHPPDHFSFASRHGRQPFESLEAEGQQQILWPDHCIQNSYGAEIHPGILGLGPASVIRKGTNPAIDSYSAFFDNRSMHQTGLDAWLKSKDISRLVVAGLATDYCVKYTVLDGLSLGYSVELFLPGCRGIKEDVNADLDEMAAAGVGISG